ncbi:glycosyltransferase [Algoriphagus namhaensis]
MLTFYLFCTFCYALLLFQMKRVWVQSSHPEGAKDQILSVSVIVPLRNEFSNIPRLMDQICRLKAPDVEVILVDDHSEDQSISLLQEYEAKGMDFKWMKSGVQGKKGAISTGIAAARGELILCSDADCIWPENWVEQYRLAFQDSRIQLVAGPVLPLGSSPRNYFFELIDWCSILLTTRFSFASQRPLMCSGANLAYRKSAFEAVNGFKGNEHLLSGDDEFLLKKVVSAFGASAVGLHYHRDNLVRTFAQSTISDLLSQRIRWASKWRMHGDFTHLFTSVFAFLIQIFWISSLFFFFEEDGVGFWSFILIWVVKMAVEWNVLRTVLRDFGLHCPWYYFCLVSVLHPFFVLLTASFAIFGKFEWKGRSNLRNSIFAT